MFSIVEDNFCSFASLLPSITEQTLDKQPAFPQADGTAEGWFVCICMLHLCGLNLRKLFLKETVISEYKNKTEHKLFQNFYKSSLSSSCCFPFK